MTLADRALPLLLSALVALHAAPASAQSAEAEVLFRDGRNLIKAGKLAPGCAKLEASERLESSVGTLLNLGDCREKLGKLASAWAAFRKAEATAKHEGNDDKREGEARRRALAIEPQMSSLTLEAPAIPGLIVKRDGEVIDAALINTAIPMDAGSYVITAEAAGYAPWRSDVVIQFKSKRRVAIPALARAAVVVTPPPPPPVVAPRLVVRHERTTWSTPRKVSLVLGLLGAGAAGTGLYFGMHANELQRDADRRCPLAVCADPIALRDNHDARDSAMRANVLYIAGGAAVASAVALWFVGGPGETTVVTPAIGDGQAGVSFAGRF